MLSWKCEWCDKPTAIRCLICDFIECVECFEACVRTALAEAEAETAEAQT